MKSLRHRQGFVTLKGLSLKWKWTPFFFQAGSLGSGLVQPYGLR